MGGQGVQIVPMNKMCAENDADLLSSIVRSSRGRRISSTGRLRQRDSQFVESLARRPAHSKCHGRTEVDSGKSKVETSSLEFKEKSFNIIRASINSPVGKLVDLFVAKFINKIVI